ncbi:WD domain-containing protein, partial [Aureobasidium melanogenum]
GSQDSRRPLSLYQLSDQAVLHSWVSNDAQSLRVNDCTISLDGSRLVAISNDNRVIVYDFKTRLKLHEWVMEDRLTCASLSHDGKSLLVSMNEGRLVLLDSDTGEVLQRYNGLTQSEFVIRSTFGGAGENFVISGSEDSRVYIWRKHTGQLVVALEAHPPGTVNSVAWHPTNPAIFASAGDDRRVRM